MRRTLSRTAWQLLHLELADPVDFERPCIFMLADHASATRLTAEKTFFTVSAGRLASFARALPVDIGAFAASRLSSSYASVPRWPVSGASFSFVVVCIRCLRFLGDRGQRLSSLRQAVCSQYPGPCPLPLAGRDGPSSFPFATALPRTRGMMEERVVLGAYSRAVSSRLWVMSCGREQVMAMHRAMRAEQNLICTRRAHA